jgi:hypothetical protein
LRCTLRDARYVVAGEGAAQLAMTAQADKETA